MKRLIFGWVAGSLLLAAGCGTAVAPPALSEQAAEAPETATAASRSSEGVLPNLPYQFLGPQALVVRYEVPEAKVRALLAPAFQPEVRNGKAAVYAILAEYHVAAVPGVPGINVKARQITYTVLCDRTGRGQDKKGFATFAVVEDQRVLSLLIRDVGYPVTTTPLQWVRAGGHFSSIGEADFDLTRKTDVISHVERTATLTKLLLGKNDHLARKGEITEVPFVYPVPVLDGYGVKATRFRLGTLEKLGLVAAGQLPADILWWESPNLIVGRRDHYDAPAR